MKLSRTTFKTTREASLCRRRQERQRIHSTVARSWREQQSPVSITVIEADVKGARLMFPFSVTQGDHVLVSFADKLGHYQTRQARIAWTQNLECGHKIVAGVAFDQELSAAA